jgi:ribosomal protein S18 acetylase RimI-like enzyme
MAMGTSTPISRLRAYYSRNGLAATFWRAGLAVRRALFSNRMALFYCDLSGEISPPVDFSNLLKVKRKRGVAELSPQDLQEMTSFWNPMLARRHMKERFGQGALLWLVKSEGRLAGYGWTLQGQTMEPHYFPLGQDDVHLFDFHVFPQYRGRGMNPFLVTHILQSLAMAGVGRAFIEAAEWNQAQLSSLTKTPFRRLAWARKATIFRHTMVWWAGSKTRKDPPIDERPPIPEAETQKRACV